MIIYIYPTLRELEIKLYVIDVRFGHLNEKIVVITATIFIKLI